MTINLKFLRQLGMVDVSYSVSDIHDYFEFIIKKPPKKFKTINK